MPSPGWRPGHLTPRSTSSIIPGTQSPCWGEGDSCTSASFGMGWCGQAVGRQIRSPECGTCCDEEKYGISRDHKQVSTSFPHARRGEGRARVSPGGLLGRSAVRYKGRDRLGERGKRWYVTLPMFYSHQTPRRLSNVAVTQRAVDQPSVWFPHCQEQPQGRRSDASSYHDSATLIIKVTRCGLRSTPGAAAVLPNLGHTVGP